MKELDEVIGNLIWNAEKIIDDGNCWVRSTDFSEIADKLIAINKKLSVLPKGALDAVLEESK